MANQHIKGITVEIGGDCSELSQVLKSVDKDAKKIDDELRSINAALKVDPSNMVALQQKTELLAQSVENAKKKLDILKKAEADAQKQLERGEIGADQYRALQREVVFAEGKLKKLEKQLEDTEKAAKGEGDAVEKSGKDAKDASQKNKELGKSLEDLQKGYDEAKDSAKEAGAEFGATLAGVGVVATAAVVQAMSYADAIDAIRMKTGASKEAMVSYELAMKSVFDSGLGENLDDVASTMAIIAQQTNETDPSKLETLAQNALVLRDGFGYETQEQLKTVDMLVKQFGIDEEKAFNLIAVASQKGLNKNGDLLDIINEYAVHYKNLGYNQDEFFNSLANGAATGVFSVDKLGDAMKEFGIKTKDEATSTTEAYELLGLNAEEMRKKFALGGKDAQEAAKQVNDALFSMHDEVKQNTAGVALYGTMWEDLGTDAIKAMTNTTGEISAAGDAMERIRDIKLDSTATKWSKLGRTVQSELLIPMGEKLLPYAEKFFTYCIENSEELIPIAKTLGTVIGAIFIVNKAAKFADSIKTLTGNFKSLKAASGTASSAMSSFGGVAGASIGTAIVAMELCKAAAEALFTTVGKKIDSFLKLSENARELSEEYTRLSGSMRESATAREESLRLNEKESQEMAALADELQGLVDAQGRVLDGDEARVNYILGELSYATGEEIELVDGVILKYDELTQSIDEMIKKRRVASALDLMFNDYNQAKTALEGDESVFGSRLAYERAVAEYEAHKHDYSAGTYRDAMIKAQYAMDANVALVGQYENLERVSYSNDQNAIDAAMYSAQHNIITAEGGASDNTLQSEMLARSAEASRLYQYSQNEGSSVTPEMIREAEQLMWRAIIERIQGAASDGMDYNEQFYLIPEIAREFAKVYGVDATSLSEQLISGVLSGSLSEAQLFSMMQERFNGLEVGYYPDSFDWERYRVVPQVTETETLPVLGNPHLTGIPLTSPNNIWARFAGATAEPIPAGVGIANDETVRRSNTILAQILKRVEDFDLQIVLEDGTLVGYTDARIGVRANDEKRGALK